LVVGIYVGLFFLVSITDHIRYSIGQKEEEIASVFWSFLEIDDGLI
jgi:hypothetical protein